MRIAIAADHAGFALKDALARDLRAAGHELMDLGTDSPDPPVDYPDYGRACAEAVARGEAAFGVVVCGSGIGMSIAANRVPGARCALVHDHLSARLARAHNDCNLIAFGARLIGLETARDALDAFLSTPFAGGRHGPRVRKLG
ncbi:MAG: ribose 5-phosphate isomerase B [Sphingomonadaceae bacterium]|uniref:ribose 5-phosphate isomerase B n=1 Tax=Thermaurantiacus sp. TaxID=2820283 RepID=UPI00298ED5DA|nr:ribose 5-phosphate isomerase B [Thermaurantiacus sp.]MCS6987264.1 ribose 5-phosphate isomerase B [Sphingomonadaceae bacterium]MDW8414484.1 ribose 5-phosphate isomerase B [Thermaurantiacus sp.]